jgi:hypothetical protein
VAESWQTVEPLETEDAAQPRRTPDLVALVPGVLFVVLAATLMTGVELPRELVRDGALFWLVLVGVGVALLVSEVRKVRRRR